MDITANKIIAGVLNIPDSISNPQPQSNAGTTNSAEKQYSTVSGVAETNPEYIEELTAKIQEYLDNKNINIAFSTYGGKSEKIAITVIEKKTGRVIREIPSEELQRLSIRMDELMGMILNEEI